MVSNMLFNTHPKIPHFLQQLVHPLRYFIEVFVGVFHRLFRSVEKNQCVRTFSGNVPHAMNNFVSFICAVSNFRDDFVSPFIKQFWRKHRGSNGLNKVQASFYCAHRIPCSCCDFRFSTGTCISSKNRALKEPEHVLFKHCPFRCNQTNASGLLWPFKNCPFVVFGSISGERFWHFDKSFCDRCAEWLSNTGRLVSN